ncbi:MAG TPA: AfsR/SARP family transcriptional regulator, partial [Mycobacteriales bacterium]|nr:AfsR/SARP family transcriptional regulator [Mycobacteriales bacterium]
LRAGRYRGGPVERLEYGILGPLEVRRGQVLVPINAPRERVVLAALLLQPNRVVAAARLIDLIWGNSPPAAAQNTLQSLVLRLRRRIEPATRFSHPAQVLITRRPGYLLRAEPGQIDLQRFEQLLARGREASLAGHPTAAARSFHEATALCRGPALVDVVTDGLRSEAARLQEGYLEATEGRIRADLDTGRHAQVVGELRALIADHPFREPLHGLLMLALYRCDRQAEALLVFRTLRAMLADDLGIEPAAALQELHRAILHRTVAPVRAPAAGRRPA